MSLTPEEIDAAAKDNVRGLRGLIEAEHDVAVKVHVSMNEMYRAKYKHMHEVSLARIKFDIAEREYVAMKKLNKKRAVCTDAVVRASKHLKETLGPRFTVYDDPKEAYDQWRSDEMDGSIDRMQAIEKLDEVKM